MIGDSLSTKGDRHISGETKGLSFAERLERDLGDDFEFINVACPGTTALNWSLSQPGALCPFHPWDAFPNGILRDRALPQLPVDVATVLLGTNDAVRRSDSGYVSPEDFGRVIDEIVDALLEGGAKTVVLIAPPDIDTPEAHGRIRAYRDQVIARCGTSEQRVCGPDLFALLDLNTHFAAGDDPLRPGYDPTQADIHPNAQGHARMAEAVGETLRQVRASQQRFDATWVAALVLALGLLAFGVAKRLRRDPPRRRGE